jgi:hypothetical protein
MMFQHNASQYQENRVNEANSLQQNRVNEANNLQTNRYNDARSLQYNRRTYINNTVEKGSEGANATHAAMNTPG